MKAEFINPFLEASAAILSQTTGTMPEKGSVFARDCYPYTSDEVTVMIGVVGELQGQVIYSMSMDQALQIAARMMFEESLPEFDEYAKSAISELANMITANVTILMAEKGVKCDISTPTVLTGTDIKISTPQVKTLVIVLKLLGGEFAINLALKRNLQ